MMSSKQFSTLKRYYTYCKQKQNGTDQSIPFTLSLAICQVHEMCLACKGNIFCLKKINNRIDKYFKTKSLSMQLASVRVFGVGSNAQRSNE